MLYILTGDNISAKQDFIGQLAKRHGTGFTDAESLAVLEQAVSQTDLFGTTQNYLVNEDLAGECVKLLPAMVSSPGVFVFMLSALPKTSPLGKAVAKLDKIKITEFALPETTKEWETFVLEKSKDLQLDLTKPALATFLQRLGVGQGSRGANIVASELLALRIDNELAKLSAYFGSREVTSEVVEQLITAETETEVFAITDLLARRQIGPALGLLSKWFIANGQDEKTSAVQFVAIFSDQLRNILIAQEAVTNRLPEAEVLAQTGWKSGRLFIMKKLATGLPKELLISTLQKLEQFDVELKTTSSPARPVLDLILSQLA